MNGEAHDWRSPDGIMEARTVGGVWKDATQGWKPKEPWKGWPFMNFGWGYFIPNTSFHVHHMCPIPNTKILEHVKPVEKEGVVSRSAGQRHQSNIY